MLVEVFGQANAVLPGESEPDVVPGVDRGRPGIIDSAGVVAGGDSGFVLGHQAPRLAGEEFPAIVKPGGDGECSYSSEWLKRSRRQRESHRRCRRKALHPSDAHRRTPWVETDERNRRTPAGCSAR